MTLLTGLLAPSAANGQATSQPATSAPVTSSVQAISSSDRLAHWREDLRVLADTLATKHKNAFTVTSREDFDAAIKVIEQELDHLTDVEAYFQLKRVVAMVGDAHTSLSDGKGRFATPYLPVSVLVLGDGVYVTAATSAHRELTGSKVVRIGETPIDEAIDRLGTLIPHENRAWVLGQVNRLILTPPALASVGLSPTSERAAFTFADAAGRERVVALEPMMPGQRQFPAPELEQQRLAVTMRGRPAGALFGCMVLPDSRDLYVWYDACRDDKNRTVAEFCKDTLETIAREKPERIIIDLRRNGGGNSVLIQPLVRGLSARDATSKPAPLFVLIGRGTFSSGLWAAEDFKRQVHAILVGGPTGGKPNSFGEQRSVELPHSGLTLTYSTKKWTRNPDGDPSSLEPDVVAEPTWADLAGGRDAAIDAVHGYNPG